ncbi:putative hydrolase of the HAD superfamily [Salsuginibacillus halophilus]|uniref:Putative hydrolase of the HAD superfamily n=1 Tax=Salsuginibacillus halophilus TaxID=517424 RepID=A0A2P8HWM8_9BACI|nr:HAD family hydrolase [Salsuginibacillus halophilus]PSL50622.1 putative hydrolase of the HAD superfamily [Salsuginibacillus halophilus]
MKLDWQNIKLVIFDLDGTLYEDTDHFEFYANELSKKLDPANENAFWQDYRAMLRGEHPVAIGRVYDAVRDRILVISPDTNEVTRIFDWSGTEVDEHSMYQEAITCDFDHYIAIGDGWWPPVAAAKHYGVGSTYDAYCRTKDFMQTEDFQFDENPGLREALEALGMQKDLVLITNSQQDDVERLLHTLNIDGVFPEVIANAKKPALTEDHFSSLLERYDVRPNEAVSIGDNYLNEVAPAERFGMKGVLIDPSQNAETKENTVVVSTLRDLFAEMRNTSV